VIAVDTNILVYAFRPGMAFHAAAKAVIVGLAEGQQRWAIPWPCVHEFLAVVTGPRIFDPPATIAEAIDQLDAWMESPSVVPIGEATGYWARVRAVLLAGRVIGGKVHDARIAALCQQHGVRELWTADRDFSRFPGLTTRNPLLPAAAGEQTAGYGRLLRRRAQRRR
jgi:uncharacterized protein